MGKPGSGITKGNILWLGSYASCQNIANAHYCLAAVSVTVSNKVVIGCSSALKDREFNA